MWMCMTVCVCERERARDRGKEKERERVSEVECGSSHLDSPLVQFLECHIALCL